VTHYRSAMRTGLRAALAADPDFGALRQLSAWAQDIDAASLPFLAVVTPRETKDLDSLDTSLRDTTLVVILKRLGGEALEDQLDDDSAALERICLSALGSLDVEAELLSVDIQLDGKGEQRLGSLTMTFRVRQWLPEPLQL
jgi:hypothetical protein